MKSGLFAVGLISISAFAGAASDVDPELRVVVEPGLKSHIQTPFPNPTEPWELEVKFVVPPLPNAPSWDPSQQVFYIWGDVDFELYDSLGPNPISPYQINQIVPQLMIGNALDGNDANYTPSWNVYDHWVIEAQYFWEKGHDWQHYTHFALAGKPVSVSPGEMVTSVISYHPETGAIDARISTPTAVSEITIPRPFPDSNPPLFPSWKEFFEAAQAKTGGVLLGQAPINVESHGVQPDTMCSVLPLKVGQMTGPGFPTQQLGFLTRQEGTFSCRTPLMQWTRNATH